MREVGVLEAKTKLSSLLADVEATGEPIAITRHGRRIARLAPEAPPSGTGGRERMSKGEWHAHVRAMLSRQDEAARLNPRLAKPYDLRADRDAME